MYVKYQTQMSFFYSLLKDKVVQGIVNNAWMDHVENNSVYNGKNSNSAIFLKKHKLKKMYRRKGPKKGNN